MLILILQPTINTSLRKANVTNLRAKTCKHMTQQNILDYFLFHDVQLQRA